jgi:hypothetical protein
MKPGILLVAITLALGGCASSRTSRQSSTTGPAAAATGAPQQPARHGAMMSREMAAMCPMAVEGTTARAEDVEGGAAMVFTTTGDVAELRRRVAHMAEMHNRHHGEEHERGMGMQSARPGSGAGHAHGGAGRSGGMMMKMPPATARSEEVQGGARLVLVPRNPADLTMLREHVHAHAQQMASGKCPMMSPHGEGAEATTDRPGDHDSHHRGGGS